MSFVRPSVADIAAYAPSKPRPGHRLHLNESPEDVPAEVKRAVADKLAALDWSRYPEATDALREKLAEVDGWTADGVLVGNGSNEFLQTLVFATLAPGDAVVLASPSFSLYATQAKAAGARVVDVSMRAEAGRPFRFDVDGLIAAAQENRANLIILASPNNPTGTLLSVADIRRVHDETRAVVALDEAYRHFAAQDLVPLLTWCERLVLMRTFSKSYAAAALRLGYVLASPALCTDLHKLMMPYNLGSLSTLVAMELLARPELVADRAAFITAERTRINQEIRQIGAWRVEDGHANFVVVEHATKPAKPLAVELAKRHLLVRDLSGYAGCDRCLRISIGTRAANDALIAALAELA